MVYVQICISSASCKKVPYAVCQAVGFASAGVGLSLKETTAREVKQVTCIYLTLPAVTLSHLTHALGTTEPRTGLSKHLINYSDCVGSTPGLAGVLTSGIVVAPAIFLISSLPQRLLDACFLVCPETSIASPLTACCQIRTLALLFAKPCPGSPSPLNCRYKSCSAHLSYQYHLISISTVLLGHIAPCEL